MKNHGRITWYESVVIGKGRPRPHWLIECAPHVMQTLKRVFARVNSAECGAVHLLDSPENAHNLLWFMERYPLEMDPEVAARMTQQAQIHVAKEEAVQGLLSGGESRLEFEMALPPREYQKVAADLAVTTGFLLLADDVGIGKTASSICALAHPGRLPALVVTLTHLPRQWKAELQKFAPGLRVVIPKKGQPYDLGWDFCPPDVIILNYHKLNGWAETLAQRIRSVVFDEIQELRHNDTAKYLAACHLARAASLRLGLSATPIHNYGGEFYNVLSVLEEDCLGTPEEFYREWCVGTGEKTTLKDPRAFGHHLRDQGLMLRRTRADVGRELPGVSIIPHEIDSDLRQLAAVEDDAAELARLILSTEKIEKGAKFRASEELSWKLRQATGLAKAPFVAEFVRLLVENGEKVVLYGWHHSCYDMWRVLLKEFKPAFYTGRENEKQKAEEIQRFIAGDTPIAVLSLRAGAGLDGLQHVCRTVVFGELDWSPGVHEQAVGRVYRDGQTDPVAAYFLISDSGSDPVVADVLGVKRMQMEGIRDPDAPLVEAGIDPNHMRKLAEDFLRQRGQLTDKTPAQDPAPPPKTGTPVGEVRWGEVRTIEQQDLFGGGAA